MVADEKTPPGAWGERFGWLPLRKHTEWRDGPPPWMELLPATSDARDWQVNRGPGLNALPTSVGGMLYVCAYVTVVWLSLKFSSTQFGVVPWGPETGLCFATFLILGKRIWPYLIVAVAAANLLLRANELPLLAQILLPFIIGGGYALALTVLADPRLRFNPTLQSSRDVRILGTVALVSTIAVACAHVALLFLTGVLSSDQVGPAIVQYATADLIGIMIVTPFLLLQYQARRLPRITIEGVLQGATIIASLVLAFAVTHLPHFRLFNVAFFPIIWIALRSGLRGVTYGLMLTQIGLIAAIPHIPDQAGNLAAFQGLMLVLALTGLAIAALVSERQRVEQELRLNQNSVAEVFRLGSAGELATAIAHEINQPLTAIANYIRLIQHHLEDGKVDRKMAVEAATKVAAQVDRMDAVIKSFRDLIKRGRPQLKFETVNDIFRETLDIVSPMLQREGIDVAVAIPRQTRKVLADKLQIEQVLINLIANSTEAMATSSNRERRLSLSAFNSPGGQGVDIIVADTGPGFPAGIDIRQPALFTTSKADGLGVGLSFSRSIVENHGGELQIGGGEGGAIVTLRLRSKMPGENS